MKNLDINTDYLDDSFSNVSGIFDLISGRGNGLLKNIDNVSLDEINSMLSEAILKRDTTKTELDVKQEENVSENEISLLSKRLLILNSQITTLQNSKTYKLKQLALQKAEKIKQDIINAKSLREKQKADLILKEQTQKMSDIEKKLLQLENDNADKRIADLEKEKESLSKIASQSSFTSKNIITVAAVLGVIYLGLKLTKII